MNCYKVYQEEKAQRIRKGEDLQHFTASEINQLQEYALDIKDIKLYDYLQSFWKGV